MVFRAVVFTFLPTAVELVLVCGLLARTFTPIVSGLVIATFAAYVTWTASLTRAAAEVSPPRSILPEAHAAPPLHAGSVEQWSPGALQVRKRVNLLDNKTTSKAVDALLNYETVKLFNNEQLEVAQLTFTLLPERKTHS